MVRFSICLLAILAMVGCRAPMPTFNPLAPYGPTRIPPPGTGSYGAADTYYQPGSGASTASEPVGTGFRSTTNATATPSAANVANAASNGGAAADDAAMTASHNSSKTQLVPAAAVTRADTPIRVSAPASGSATSMTSKLRGMHVNDATAPAEPAPFSPPSGMVDISQLPDASTPPTSPVRGQPTPATPPTVPATVSIKTAATRSGTGPSGAVSAGWQTR